MPSTSEAKKIEGPFYVNLMSDRSADLVSQDANNPDIDWFKKELRISPKYVEKQEGVLGLSWAHFLTMVFLICSFFVALLAVIIRHRRTRELMSMLLEEEKKDGSKS
jgi:4-amino-4-deoxy-L-arabinose transferase-like glycosyltransferase